MTRRGQRVLVLAAAMTWVLVGSMLTTPAQAEPPLQFGAHQWVRSGMTKQSALERLETIAGRRMAAVRQFYQWDAVFPTSFETGLRTRGQTLVMSVKSKRLNGTLVPWAQIAAAQPGSARHSEMVSWARRVRDYQAPVYVTFNHEPEAPVSEGMGTSSEYIAAWRKWVSIFRQQGASNVKFMWIMTDESFWLPASHRRAAVRWYPGDSWVDGIAGDAYNWFTCRPGIRNAWRSLREIVDAQRQFGASHPAEELWLTEYATADDPADPTRKAQWYADARALFKTAAFSVFDGVMLFEPSYPFETCNWRPDTTSATAAAWRSWAQDPYYGGPGLTAR
jgi:hypothetical protein